MATRKSELNERLDAVRERIAAAAARARRDPSEVTLVAVTKAAAPEQIREILQLGVTDVGESRVQQLTQRSAQMQEMLARRSMLGETAPSAKVRWHMIGHLQRNKVKPLLQTPGLAVVHSIDSLRLAEEIDLQAAKLDRKVSVLVQVNAGEEPQKSGVAVGAALHLAEQLDSMANLQVVGLMTMAPFDAAEAAVRQCFSRTREVFEEMRWQKIGGPGLRHLSMGMSHDYEWAIEEGATLVRIGSALFGGEPGTDHAAEKDD